MNCRAQFSQERSSAKLRHLSRDMVSARKIADHIAMLHNGRIIWQGPAAEIDRTDNPVFGREVAAAGD